MIERISTRSPEKNISFDFLSSVFWSINLNANNTYIGNNKKPYVLISVEMPNDINPKYKYNT